MRPLLAITALAALFCATPICTSAISIGEHALREVSTRDPPTTSQLGPTSDPLEKATLQSEVARRDSGTVSPRDGNGEFCKRAQADGKCTLVVQYRFRPGVQTHPQRDQKFHFGVYDTKCVLSGVQLHIPFKNGEKINVFSDLPYVVVIDKIDLSKWDNIKMHWRYGKYDDGNLIPRRQYFDPPIMWAPPDSSMFLANFVGSFTCDGFVKPVKRDSISSAETTRRDTSDLEGPLSE